MIENIKPVSGFAPIAIIEIDWAPEGYNAWDKGSVIGEAGAFGFGVTCKALDDKSGNVKLEFTVP